MRVDRWPRVLLCATIFLGLIGTHCGRDRNNPLDPQSSAFASRPGPPTEIAGTGLFGRIQISWTPPEFTNVLGYGVYRSTSPTGTFDFLSGDVAGDTLITTGRNTFVDSSFTGEALIYYYRISTVNRGRLVSDLSNPVGVELIPDTSPPAPPQNLSVLTDLETGEVILGWTPPSTDATGSDLTGLSGFRIYRSEGTPDAFALLVDTTSVVTSFVDKDVKGGTQYFYAVSALDPPGNESARSEVKSLITSGIATPGGLAAVGDVSKIILAWNPNTEEDLSGYNVYRSDRSDGEFVRLGPPEAPFTTGLSSYADSNLVGGSTFFYRVSAVTTTGEGSQSGHVGATVKVDDQPPAAPTNLLTELDRSVITRVTLRWTPPSQDNNGEDLTGLLEYKVYRNNVEIATTVDPTYQDNSVVPLTSYTYNISAIDPNDNEGPRSDSEVVTTFGISVPANVSATGDVFLIRVSWDPNEELDLLGYRVYRATSSTGTFSPIEGVQGTTITTAKTTFADSNLAAGTQLFYKVLAVASTGVSELSRFVEATVLDDERPPAPPDVNFLTVEVSPDDPVVMLLAWRAPTKDVGDADLTGLMSYRIYRSTSPSGSFEQIAQVDAPTVSYTDDDPTLESSTEYSYRISAVDPKGNESPLTTPVTGQTGGVPAPTNLNVVASQVDSSTGQAALTWNAPTLPGAADYVVERQQVGSSSSSTFEAIGFPQTTTFTDTGLARGESFAYRVRSRNSARTQTSDPTEVRVVVIP